jgi:hypothetical protein
MKLLKTQNDYKALILLLFSTCFEQKNIFFQNNSTFLNRISVVYYNFVSVSLT